MTSDFLSWFRERFGAPFPIPMAQLQKQPGGDAFWATPNVGGVSPPMVPKFFEGIGDYTLAGEWGRGINTYACYFVDVRGPHRRFFRVFSGGVYALPEEKKGEVVTFLAAYEQWRMRYESRLASSSLVHNLDVTEADVVLADGRTCSLARADEGATFWTTLATIIEAPPAQ